MKYKYDDPVDFTFLEKADPGSEIWEWKGRDFKNLSRQETFQFAKANKTFGEPGVSFPELEAIDKGMATFGTMPITSFETGVCYGTTTRYFMLKALRDGGQHYAVECKPRELFEKSMKDLGLWESLNLIVGNSMKIPWDKQLDYLYIDSEHGITDALGEYMRYRVFLKDNAIVGFHDTNCCLQVQMSIDVIRAIDVLEPIASVDNKAAAGIQVFRVVKLNENTPTLKDKKHIFDMLREANESAASGG